jgi:hypothetical protein
VTDKDNKGPKLRVVGAPTFEDSQREAIQKIWSTLEAFERELKVGDLVEVRWRSGEPDGSGTRYHAARATAMAIGSRRIQCRLMEDVGADKSVGGLITAPRMDTLDWSADRGVFPVPHLQGILIDAKGARVERPLRRDQAIIDLLGGDCDGLEAETFYVSTHAQLRAEHASIRVPFVALHDRAWPGKSLPIHNPRLALRGALFIVHAPYHPRGYWQSLRDHDVLEFADLYQVDVDWQGFRKPVSR